MSMSSTQVGEAVAQANAAAPLKGDGSGIYRVHIVGNSGTGKSTLANELGTLLNVPVIHLDRLHWNPGWVKTPPEAFQSKVAAVLDSDACSNGWVVDGSYSRKLTDQLNGATDIIWLDTPFLLYFPRLLKRTFLRLLRWSESCAPGCDEQPSEVFFSRSSILWWAISHHRFCQRRERARLQTEGEEVGGKMRRIGGWGKELLEWKQAVSEMRRVA